MSISLMVCRDCGLMYQTPPKRGTIHCEQCGLVMETVADPVDFYVNGFSTPQAKQRCEEALTGFYERHGIRQEVGMALRKFPALVLSPIDREQALALAKDLDQAGVSVRIRQFLTEVPKTPSRKVESFAPLDGEEKVVLVVDDSPSVRSKVSATLKEKGFCVLTAADGIEGIMALQRHSIHLVLCDLNMPRLGGLKLVGTMKGNPETRTIPIHVLTAKANAEDVVKAAALGIEGYIVKPFDEATLLEKIYTSLGLE